MSGAGPRPHLGITPAWAGKRSRSQLDMNYPRDHPRVGGEKQYRIEDPVNSPGSPPRGRGKASPIEPFIGFNGITPAWAGKRLWAGYVFHGEWDHPRVGGEKQI